MGGSPKKWVGGSPPKWVAMAGFHQVGLFPGDLIVVSRVPHKFRKGNTEAYMKCYRGHGDAPGSLKVVSLVWLFFSKIALGGKPVGPQFGSFEVMDLVFEEWAVPI